MTISVSLIRRPLAYAIVICACLLPAACSTLEEILVLNRSSEPIQVSYVFKTYGHGPPLPRHVTPPSTASLADLDERNRKWTALAEHEWDYDASSGTLSLWVWPGRAALIAEVGNYGGHRILGHHGMFPIEKLTITGESGSILLGGLQAEMQFRPRDGRHHDWVIEYKETS